MTSSYFLTYSRSTSIESSNPRKMGFIKLLLKSCMHFVVLVGIFTLIPSPNKETFTAFTVAPQLPLTGKLALNEKLSGASRLFEDQLKGPEGLLCHNNTLYITLNDGHVVKLVDNQITPVANFGEECGGLHEDSTCGRPLGLSMDKKGFLYVTDVFFGVFKVNVNSSDQYGQKEQLVFMNEAIDGVRPKLPNSVVAASDGSVYWTDSSSSHSLYDSFYLFFDDERGRLLKYDPKTKKNTVLMNNLACANGVELADDESFIIVTESFKYRILKYFLKGPNAGKSEVFIDGLPGIPDNIKKFGKGSFYFPLILSRIPIFENIGAYPTIRMMIVKFFGILNFTFKTIDSFYPNTYSKTSARWTGSFELISFIFSRIEPRLSIIKVDEKGNIISSWHNTNGSINGISDVAVVGENLYLGSPFNKYLGVLKLPHDFV